MVADPHDEDGKKKIVVVKRDDEDGHKKNPMSTGDDSKGKTTKVTMGEKNLNPLAGPTEVESKDAKIKQVDNGKDVVLPAEKKDLNPLAGPDAVTAKEDKDKKSIFSSDASDKAVDSKSDKSGASKSGFGSSGGAKGGSSKASVTVTSVGDTHSAGAGKAGAIGAGVGAAGAGAAGMAYAGSSGKNCAKCNKSDKDCKCTDKKAGNSHVVIDESKNKSHKVTGNSTGFAPCKLENPTTDSILCELRRKNSVLAEGFVFKKRAFFFCFWVKKYFVLLKTGELLWLENDGSGAGSGNWNIKRATAFNKLDYEGYSHPHRFTFSADSATGYLAFDTEVERNYWLDKLQDLSRG